MSENNCMSRPAARETKADEKKNKELSTAEEHLRFEIEDGCVNRIVKVGESLPDYSLYENEPNNKVNIKDIFVGKKGIVVGVIGAFNPDCSHVFLRGYIDSVNDFKEHGYDTIVCITVNDPFVCQAWAKECQAEGRVRILADPDAKFTKALGLQADPIRAFGNIRSSRYALVVDNNQVKMVFNEIDNVGLQCSLAQNVLDNIKNENLAK